MKIFKMAIHYLTKYKLYLIFFILLNMILWVLAMGTPYITGKYVDFLIESRETKIIYYFTAAIFIIEIFTTIVSYSASVLLTKFQSSASFDLNARMLEHVKKLPLLYFKNIDSVYLNERINSDSNTVISFVLNNLISIVIKIITLVFSLYLLFNINTKLTLILLSLIPLYIVLYFVFKNPLFKSGYELKENKSKFFSKMNEQLFNIRIIKINGTFKLLEEQLKHNFRIVYKSLVKYSKLSYLFSSCDSIVGSFSKLILFFFGGLEVFKGNMTIGEFTIVGNYFTMLINCTSYYLNLGKNYQNALISYNRLNKILDIATEHNGNIVLDNIETIEFEKVDFSYNKNNSILHNFNYKFEKGNIYGIIGENGAGKSTLVNLSLGLFDGEYEGNIYYNSKDIKDLDLYSIRKNLIGLTEQEPALINDSIAANLTYGLNDIDENTVNNWCTKLNIYDFINELPDGFNSSIYEKSNNISGGEKQKISLAKLFIKDPEVIILDEPTSALDVGSVQNLKDIIKEIKNNKIIIIITHSKEIIDVCDEVINL